MRGSEGKIINHKGTHCCLVPYQTIRFTGKKTDFTLTTPQGVYKTKQQYYEKT